MAAQKSKPIPAPTTSSSSSKTSLAAVSLLFISGVAALVYEVTWQRQFALVFGSNSAATAAVLASFFAGLGLGSLFLGARARRWKRPLAAYAILELGVALGALLVAPILQSYEHFYPLLFERFSDSPALFTALKTALAFLAIALPTICMGGTLPVLGDFATQLDSRLGVSAGLLYAVNTFGAAAGALAVPFLLMPSLAIQQITWLAAFANLLTALLAFYLSRSFPAPSAVIQQVSTSPERSLLFLSGLSGFATFVLQVEWNRAFAQVHENSIYSFALITTIFIGALALGADLARLSLKRWNSPRMLLGRAWIIGGLISWMGPYAFVKFTQNLAYVPSGNAWISYALDLLKLALPLIALPVIALGMALPLLMQRLHSDNSASPGKALGRLLATNIIGTVAGALCAGFLFPPLLGTWTSIALIGLILFVAGFFQITPLRPPTVNWSRAIPLALVLLVLCWVTFSVNLPRVSLASGENLLHLREGTHGIVAVTERPNSRRLKLNNYYVLGGTSAVGDERMQAHLPLLLHPQPTSVAFLGVGTGITAGGALFHPLSNITLVELVPEVIQAASQFFRDANGGILQDQRSRIVLDDARNFMRGTTQKFDVIISDLVVPWRQGEGALYTLEHFAALKRATAANGLVCVWAPCFQLSETEMNILVRTFLNIFPKALLLRGDFSPDQPALALISGGNETLDFHHIEQRLADFKDPANPHLLHPIAFWMHFAAIVDNESFPAAPLNTESRPLLELSSPLQHAGSRTASLLVGRRLQTWLAQFQQSPVAQKWLSSPVVRDGMNAGNQLAEVTLLLSEGKRAQAAEAQQRLQQVLPPAVFSLLFP